MSYVTIYQRVTSAEEDFNNRADRMTPSVDTSQFLPPAISAIHQLAHQQSGPGGRDGGYISSQQSGLILTKANLATANAECRVRQQQRPRLSPQMAPFPGVTSLVAG